MASTGTVFDDLSAPAPTGTVFDDVHPAVMDSSGPSVSYNPLPQIWQDIKGIPGTALQFLKHPLDTTKSMVGEMNLQDPSKSSGLLGLPDVMYERYKAGQRGGAVAPIAELLAGRAASELTPEGVGTAAKATAGAVKGAAKAAVEPVTYGRFHFPIPAPLAGAAAGHYGGSVFGPEGSLIGTVVGGGAPLVKGAIQGAREALAGPEPPPFEPFTVKPGIQRILSRGASGGTGQMGRLTPPPNVNPAMANAESLTPSGQAALEPPPTAPEPFKVNPKIKSLLNRQASGGAGQMGRLSAPPRRGINRAMEGPAPVESADPFLDDLAQSQAKKPFAKLKPDEQQSIRDLAARLKGTAKPMTPPPSQPMAAPPQFDPVSVAEWLKDPVKAQATVAEMQKGASVPDTPPAPKPPFKLKVRRTK